MPLPSTEALERKVREMRAEEARVPWRETWSGEVLGWLGVTMVPEPERRAMVGNWVVMREWREVGSPRRRWRVSRTGWG